MGRFWAGFCVVWGLVCGITATARAQSVSPALTASSLPLPSSAGHFEVALHARSMRVSARAEQAAWLTVTLPLDKLALPRVAQQPSVPEPVPPTPAAAPAKASSPLAANPPAAAPVAAPASEAPRVTFEQLHALAEFSRRATVVALSVAGAAAERRRLDSLSSRARASALLPELRLRAVRNTDQALRLVPTTDDPYRVTQADGAGMILEASATFRLDRLLFAHEELVVERLRLRAGTLRLKLEARVQTALFGLFRAHELACADDANDSAQLSEVVKALELFAELDNLTAGWFSEQAPSFGRVVWGFPEAVLGLCQAPLPASPAAGTNPVASLENSE
jgi:hypothetical protein